MVSGGAGKTQSWILRPYAWYSVVIVGSLLRNGPEIQGTTLRTLAETPVSDPVAASPSLAFTLVTLGRHSGLLPAVGAYLMLSVALVALIFWNIRSLEGLQRQVFVLLVAVGPWTSVVIKDFPTTDAFTFLGALVAVTATNWPVRLLGILIFATSHPEAATITGAVLLSLVLVKVRPFGSIRELTFISLWSIALGLPLAMWAASQGGVRSSVFWNYLPGSVTLFAATAPLAIYAWLGALWVALVFALMRRTWPTWPILGSIVVLASLSIVTAGGTRVAAVMLVTFASTLALEYVRRNEISPVLTQRALLLLLMPAIVISNGLVNLPFDEALTFLGIAIPRP